MTWMGLGVGSADAAPRRPAEGCSVALYGDSILRGGYGGTVDKRLADPPAAALRRMRPAWSVTDHSVVGESAHVRRPTFVKEAMSARVIVIQYGINDAGNGYAYEPALRAMIEHIRDQGKTAVVTGIARVKPGALGTRQAYDAIARRVAAETGAVFADWNSVAFDAAEMADGIHPGQPYSTRLAERIAVTLDRVAPECL